MKLHKSELLFYSMLSMYTVALEPFFQIQFIEGWGAFLKPSDH